MGSGSSRPSGGSPLEAMAGLEGVNVKRVASTAFHGLAVSNLGVAYSFGDGKSGRLGHGDEEGLMVPRSVAALQGERVSAIAAGGEHSSSSPRTARSSPSVQAALASLGTATSSSS